jgi:hypothetical protein
MSETHDELRTRLDSLHVATTEWLLRVKGDDSEQVGQAYDILANWAWHLWPTIDALLARLATAEADADQLYDMLDTHWDGGACCNDWATEDDEVMQLHREAVARREQP